MTDHNCPGCGAAMAAAATATQGLGCPECGGRIIGLSPFERMTSSGVGMAVWRACVGGSPAGPCPYCGQAMHRPDGAGDGPADGQGQGAEAVRAGLAVCRICQEVWFPKEAVDWLAAHASPTLNPDELANALGRGPEVSASAECHNCGAPFEPDPDGKCPYCRAQLAAPTPVVMVMEQPAYQTGGFRLF